MNWSAESLLILHAAVSSLMLIASGCLLLRNGLLSWDTAGFWAWTSFCLYFVLSPLAVTIDDSAVYRTELYLLVSGGASRSLWILFVSLFGIAVFFIVYLRSNYRPVTWHLSGGTPRRNWLVLYTMIPFIAFGLYSLFFFRSGLFSTGGAMIIEAGRFVGNITGYQHFGYAFLYVPIVWLLQHQTRGLRAVGWILATVFVLLSLPHSGARFATVSFLLAVATVTVLRKSRRWPSWRWTIGILLITIMFQLRGHVQWRYGNIVDEAAGLLNELPERSNEILSSGDTFMLQSWYVFSYLEDEWIGYDYGLPMVNYLLTGWIPSRVLPTKYFIIDWFNSYRAITYPAIFYVLLHGAKSSLFGSFYDHGGLIGVLIGAALAGYLSRRLDGMLDKNTPILVKSIAISWLANLWMVWGSHDTWGLMVIGAIALPGLAIWVVSPKEHP